MFYLVFGCILWNSYLCFLVTEPRAAGYGQLKDKVIHCIYLTRITFFSLKTHPCSLKNNHTCTQNNILSAKYLQMNWERYTHVHTRHQLFLSPPSLIPLFSLFNISPKRSHGALSTPLLMYFLCPQIQLVAVKFSCSQSPGVWMLYLSRFFAALKMEYSL